MAVTSRCEHPELTTITLFLSIDETPLRVTGVHSSMASNLDVQLGFKLGGNHAK